MHHFTLRYFWSVTGEELPFQYSTAGLYDGLLSALFLINRVIPFLSPIAGGDPSERPVPPPRPRSTLDTSGLSSMHSPSSHSHDSLLKLNMDSVQEELKRKLTSPQRETLRSTGRKEVFFEGFEWWHD